MFRTAVRRRSWNNLPGTFAASHALAQAFRKSPTDAPFSWKTSREIVATPAFDWYSRACQRRSMRSLSAPVSGRTRPLSYHLSKKTRGGLSAVSFSPRRSPQHAARPSRTSSPRPHRVVAPRDESGE